MPGVLELVGALRHHDERKAGTQRCECRPRSAVAHHGVAPVQQGVERQPLVHVDVRREGGKRGRIVVGADRRHDVDVQPGDRPEEHVEGRELIEERDRSQCDVQGRAVTES